MTSVPVPQSRLLATAIPGPRSVELHAERLKHVTSGFGITLPVFIDRADGAILQDVDGNRIIDFASGIAVTSVGASNPNVQAHVGDQLTRFTHTCFMVTEYDSFTAVCRWLNEHTPGEFEKRTALFSTGAEAIENAIKIARSATGRQKVLVFDDAYHGRSLLTMAMTAKENPYKLNFGPFPTEVIRAPFAAPLRWPTGAENATAEALAAVERILDAEGPQTFAAMVIEPIQGEGGFIVASPGFLPGLREIATRHGIVFVLDEIQAGMGRTGLLFASNHEQVAGDLTVTAKALAGGLPLSAVTGRVELMNAVHAGGLGGTYAGNPLACAAALGVFEAFEDGALVANACRIEAVAREMLDPLLSAAGIVVDVRGRGAMLAVEFADRDTLAPRAELAKEIAARCHAQGLLVLVCGTYSNVIRLLPPLVIEEALLRDGLTVLRDVVVQVDAAARETATREDVAA
ncbi:MULTISPECIES: aminotransferase class III-fold pyridoxal phosphate-dependent enzyme [unclassified Cryobacterium]|uniref:aminotransferase class III-fold pyridoxal phosphate-dependent enzyme n=1 Tax=unclassified Cryobacterium TaxID=2649013 RepID=UPI0010695B76|nr:MULTISPECIES: aminotransferase class III-fold pyridoxal phosphate-dependent enzyme [unclassified Cryobacterium]TFD07653.1 aminotransferase class III-fold pyridoxal phosphate-dependent enzyme [Cryobacterium sp. TMT1-66-1]TFD08058.1 aminotransferase class III-fold pyridoxal phosphate-dependent enzyme [Cryobacterium sp. TMT1-2-2]